MESAVQLSGPRDLAKPELDVRTDVRDGARVVSVAGEIDLATTPQLERALKDAVELGERSLVLDLRGVSYMDSTGLGTLVRTYRRTGELGKPFTIVAQNPHLERLFKMLGFQQFLRIYPTLEQAIAAK